MPIWNEVKQGGFKDPERRREGGNIDLDGPEI
jgi:hypothetical protein